MKTVHQVRNLTGVSVRTLHHYDKIGLLKPTELTESGYRLYDDAALARLQTILLFRELQFPLKEIKAIIDSPGFDRESALNQQIDLLELQRKRLSDIISFSREIIRKGVNNMDFSAFDKTEIEKYSAEAKAKWGTTAAYKECGEKTKNQTDKQAKENAAGIMKIFAKIGHIRHLEPDSHEAQNAVENLRRFITENYYKCTPEILKGLGEMYTGDQRFKNNIDNAGGEGTAEFSSKAIEIYCSNCDSRL